ncbi:hypothetical protein AALK94_16145 [Bacteroides faecichinchillae]|uniref:hypothetical protein n=1 Tax=Bacteroides faecichinchillae TaxID=871325 RepID=UPI003515FF1F
MDDLEKTLELKRTNLKKLIQNADKAIRREMLKYEEAELYIRLQSECFNLYPVVVKALSLQITNDRKREVFCSILNGHKLKDVAAAHGMSPEQAGQEFNRAVWNLNKKVNNGAFTAKESVNIQLLHERNMLKNKVLDYDRQYHQLELENKKLSDQVNILLKEKKRYTKYKLEIMHEIEQVVQEQATKKHIEKQESPKHTSIIMRCVQWLKKVYFQL